MIRETCSRTGTLLSLKAVVMKQPKVSAAITLREKANREFARDSTVFIATVSQEPCLHTGCRLAFPQQTGFLRSARLPCARFGSARRRRPASFPVFKRAHARALVFRGTPTAWAAPRWSCHSATSPPPRQRPCTVANHRRERVGRGSVSSETGDPPPQSCLPLLSCCEWEVCFLLLALGFGIRGLNCAVLIFMCHSFSVKNQQDKVVWRLT